MKFSLVFTQDKVQPAKKIALKKLSQNLTLKGFRQGKAPLDLVELQLDPQKVIEEIAAQLLPPAYRDHILKNKLQPITQPHIQLKKMVADGDWEYEVEIAERPEVKLNDYQKAIKAKKIKVDKDDKDANSKKLNAILEVLLHTATVEIPHLLIDQEVNHSLSQLIDQVDKLGLKIDQYLNSLGKTAEQLRQEYHHTAENNLKLEFILDAIAKDQKFNISDQEVDVALKTADPKTAEFVKHHPDQLANLKYSLIKQKVVGFLTQL